MQRFHAFEVVAGKEHCLKMKAGDGFHLSLITLPHNCNGHCSLYVSVNGKTYAIATLDSKQNILQVCTDLVFGSTQDAVFHVNGGGRVNCTGYIQPLLDEDDESSDDDLKNIANNNNEEAEQPPFGAAESDEEDDKGVVNAKETENESEEDDTNKEEDSDGEDEEDEENEEDEEEVESENENELLEQPAKKVKSETTLPNRPSQQQGRPSQQQNQQQGRPSQQQNQQQGRPSQQQNQQQGRPSQQQNQPHEQVAQI